jgi:hypothetical protein
MTVLITFGFVNAPKGDPAAAPVTFDTTSSQTPHRYYILKARYVDGSEPARPWQVLLTRDYYPIPVNGCVREGDVAGGIFRLPAGTSISVSEAEWIALQAVGAA